MEGFIETVKSADHASRLGGISGDVAELGAAQLVQMLGNTAPAGTLVVHRGAEERSEEHTSELQSLRHLVCRLLLEKKKKQKTTKPLIIHIITAKTTTTWYKEQHNSQQSWNTQLARTM